MAKFHPSVDLLTEYVAGILPLAQSACISAHLNYCPQCQQQSARLQDLGAVLFDSLTPVPVGDALLNTVLARLDEEPPLSYRRAQDPAVGRLPALLQRLMKGDFSELSWNKITSSLRISYLKTGDPGYEFALYHIKAGGKIPEHTHRGSEMTLILQGGFSDAAGSYHEGDFLFREASDTHAPTALQSEDCICLAVLDAPLRFTGWKYRWMNPFLQLRAG
ncbi:ChrR family anti-sigma-E factor [Haliea sp.]|jgi:putative transcriptional regulator|uniref:ChrR family anti-sigma-E factor n=1 Tax=Haliea TaxID=475794 RepID=UPI000C5C1BBF|nr:ChrR family anti-sigma-E factor [Haliea sp.]HAN67280.1 transcriptional regulator [Halieaceae bacterium]MAD63793.1 transcriptional regulator [Haliea sp.]MAY92154.1 transcriptional regulator [Haliea sp.]MBK42078.1 transcriptional regulator [Haliea sp.]MBP69862.1 transcriptional regulator [Haliea sp.]|tara:strand:- start:21500 stop:22156 length:657 start_codon:yes stop_codon:yes gene_type:complete